jgi:hypothetical protein
MSNTTTNRGMFSTVREGGRRGREEKGRGLGKEEVEKGRSGKKATGQVGDKGVFRIRKKGIPSKGEEEGGEA